MKYVITAIQIKSDVLKANRYCLLNQRVFALFLLKLGFDLQILEVNNKFQQNEVSIIATQMKSDVIKRYTSLIIIL